MVHGARDTSTGELTKLHGGAAREQFLWTGNTFFVDWQHVFLNLGSDVHH